MTHQRTRAEGLPPSARMQKRGEFLRCQSGGARNFGRHAALVHSPNRLEHDRLGVVVTKKTGNAVIRNRWKRCIRECFRRRPKTGRVTQDWVVMVKRTVQGPPPKDFSQELLDLWKKAEQ